MDPKTQRLVTGILAAGTAVWLGGLTGLSHSAEGRARASEWGENPFLIERRKASAASAPVAADSGGLTLNGILWDPAVPSAIVNSRLVSVGDRLGSWEILEIRKDQVILSDGTATQTLTVE